MARMIAERSDVVPVVAEVFRTHGYEGATLSVITEATGLGKGSLYHFFPGGKEELAAAVLEEIESWFRVNVFAPLASNRDPEQAVKAMLAFVESTASEKSALLVSLRSATPAIDLPSKCTAISWSGLRPLLARWRASAIPAPMHSRLPRKRLLPSRAGWSLPAR